jgi:hypothetical protein
MKLWLTERERKLAEINRQSILEDEKINQGKDYYDYVREDLKKKRCTLEEANWSVNQSKKRHYIPKGHIAV